MVTSDTPPFDPPFSVIPSQPESHPEEGTTSDRDRSLIPSSSMTLLDDILKVRGWDRRDGQVKMVEAFAGPRDQGQPQVAVTAPVGTGKTLGLLVGSLPWARRIMVTTSTKNLQRQVGEELAELSDNLMSLYGYRLRYMIMKGRANYLNIERTEALLRYQFGALPGEEQDDSEDEPDFGGPVTTDTDDDDRVGVSVSTDKFTEEHWEALTTAYTNTVAAMTNHDFIHLDQGDLIALMPFEMQSQVCVSRNDKHSRSPWPTGDSPDLVDEVIAKARCPWRMAYAASMKADILVINISLLTAEMVKARALGVMKPSLLPETDIIVMDEAHHSEQKFREGMTKQYHAAQFARELSMMLGRMEKAGMPSTDVRHLKDQLSSHGEAIANLADRGASRTELATELTQFAMTLGDATTGMTVRSGAPRALSVLAAPLRDNFISVLNETAESLTERARDSDEPANRVDVAWWSEKSKRPISFEDDRPIITVVPIDLTDVADSLSYFARTFQPFIRGTEGASFQNALENHRGRGYIGMCSGTMTKSAPTSLGMFEVRYEQVSSPFSPFAQRLFLPTGLPEPKGKQRIKWYQSGWTEAEKAILASGGRTLFLCTSDAAIREFSDKALRSDALKRAGISVLVQHKQSDKAELTRKFREHHESVLFGTINSFGEGVDIPGPSLSLVVIDKIPFPLPDDPIHKAREASAARRGISTFMVSTDAASVMFAQGAGRLIRSNDCIGGVMTLDPRIANTRYGSKIIALLPPESCYTNDIAQFCAWQKMVIEKAGTPDIGRKAPKPKDAVWRPLAALKR